MNPRTLLFGAILFGGVAYYAAQSDETPVVEPKPVAPVAPPKVEPPPKPTPKPPRTPWDTCGGPVGPNGKCQALTGMVKAKLGGSVHDDGTEIQIDLPVTMHQRNTGGSDGAGLCVYASCRHSGLWCDEPCFTEQFNWMKKHPGGSYPSKFDKTTAAMCKEKGIPMPAYLSLEINDMSILEQACEAGLMPAVTTMNHSHMISLVHADKKHYVTLDNNLPGKYNWRSPAEFKQSFLGGQRTGWCIIPLKPGPPPIPMNPKDIRHDDLSFSVRLGRAVAAGANAFRADSLGVLSLFRPVPVRSLYLPVRDAEGNGWLGQDEDRASPR